VPAAPLSSSSPVRTVRSVQSVRSIPAPAPVAVVRAAPARPTVRASVRQPAAGAAPHRSVAVARRVQQLVDEAQTFDSDVEAEAQTLALAMLQQRQQQQAARAQRQARGIRPVAAVTERGGGRCGGGGGCGGGGACGGGGGACGGDDYGVGCGRGGGGNCWRPCIPCGPCGPWGGYGRWCNDGPLPYLGTGLCGSPCGPYGNSSCGGSYAGVCDGGLYGWGASCGPYGSFGPFPRTLSVTQPVLAASTTCNPVGGCATVTQPALQTCTPAGCFTQPIGPPNLASVGAYCPF
jgi:hypothetical protein